MNGSTKGKRTILIQNNTKSACDDAKCWSSKNFINDNLEIINTFIQNCKKVSIPLIYWNHRMNNSTYWWTKSRMHNTKLIFKREQFWLKSEYKIMKTKSMTVVTGHWFGRWKQWMLLTSGAQVPCRRPQCRQDGAQETEEGARWPLDLSFTLEPLLLSCSIPRSHANRFF